MSAAKIAKILADERRAREAGANQIATEKEVQQEREKLKLQKHVDSTMAEFEYLGLGFQWRDERLSKNGREIARVWVARYKEEHDSSSYNEYVIFFYMFFNSQTGWCMKTDHFDTCFAVHMERWF